MRICVKELEQVLREQRLSHPEVKSEDELIHFLPYRVFGKFFEVHHIDYDCNGFAIIESPEDLKPETELFYVIPLEFVYYMRRSDRGEIR